jgi:DNA (cytosine-5)-methyltransferase 1
MSAFYNEIDPYAAAWLRNLIAAGHVAPGVVDERSIEDIEPAELAQYTQCHFFAGIGAWSHALRLAGWPDDRPVWTGSCPCQPFSSAGKGAGFADERHLWPAFCWLISQCRPPIVFGEQVASKDGLGWLDLVQADLEGSGYATGAADLCAAGVGAPHIRQRLYWVADAASAGLQTRDSHSVGNRKQEAGLLTPHGSNADGLADAQHDDGRADKQGRGPDKRAADGGSGAVVRLDNNNKGLEGHGWRHRAEIGHGPGALGSVAEAGELGGVADAESIGEASDELRPDSGAGIVLVGSRQGSDCGDNGRDAAGQPAARPTDGHWRAADWLHCRDGKWRPVEPGTFPLAHGAPSRVGRLRAYGNAIVPQVAQAFIEAVMSPSSVPHPMPDRTR